MSSRHIPIFVDQTDAAELFAWLSNDPEIAFLWHAPGAETENFAVDGKVLAMPLSIQTMEVRDQMLRSKRWKAYERLNFNGDRKYCLWHVPSGKVMCESLKMGESPWIPVTDPWTVWTAQSGGIPDAPAVPEVSIYLTLELATVDKSNPDLIGISGISLQGMRWNAAPEPVKQFWTRLKYNLTRRAMTIPGNGINTSVNEQYLCMPSAFARIKRNT